MVQTWLTWRSLLAVGVALLAISVAYLGTLHEVIQSVFHPSPTRPVLLLLGDSLTEQGTNPDNAGWASLLQHHYQRSADVLPRGLGGYNTKSFIELALPVVKREASGGGVRPTLIMVWLGANDAALVDGPSRRQHVPVSAYAANLKEIVRSLQWSAPRADFLLITPPHVDDEARRKRSSTGELDRSNAATGEYARACVEVGKELGVPVVDLHSLFNSFPSRQRSGLLRDGLHLSEWGNRVLERLLQAEIANSFPELMSRLEEKQIPDWDQQQGT